MDTDGERNDKKKAAKWICEVCAAENLRKAKVCKKCNNDKGTTADGHQSDETSPMKHDAADGLPPDLGGTEKNKSRESLPILADMKAIIHQLENEIQQQNEDRKSAIKSKQKHFKRITQAKQQIIQKLDEASRLLSDELFATRNLKPHDTILIQKRIGLMAERETQWVEREKHLLDKFEEKRKQELIEIENEWAERWKREMEDKWSTIALYIKADLPEIEMDTRKKQFIEKSTSELKLKLEGMKNMWEMRNKTEWMAHRLITKFQWDNESGQLWKVEKQNFITKPMDDVVPKAETGINTDSQKVIDMLEICKIQMVNVSKSAKSLMKVFEKTTHTIENHTSKEVEGYQQLHAMMDDVSDTIQRQDEDLKTLKKKNKELQNTFNAAKDEIKSKKLMMHEEHKRNKAAIAPGNGNKQPIETYQVSATSTWKCEYCTMDNPETKYICDACDKLNAKQRDRINLEAGKVKDQRHRPGKLPKEILSNLQGCDTQEKSIPKSKQSVENDEELDCGEYKDGEDPFKSFGQPGQSRDIDSNEQPNQINQNKTPTWTCEHCTLENPLNQYICDSCGKTNDELRTTIGDENGAVQKQKRQTFESKEGTATGHEGVNINWQPVNVEQYADANGWQCGHCTMANPLDQYICKWCGKTNAEQRENIGHEKGVEQKHDLQKSKSSKDHSTESKFKDDQNYYNPDMDAEHLNSLASLSSEEIKDLNADENWVEPDNALEQPEWFQKTNTFIRNLFTYFRSKGNEKEAQRIIELSRIPWGYQNNEIKRNYRQIVADEKMESGSRKAEIAAILQYIYPQADVDLIVDSLLQNKDINETIKAISKHQKKN